MQPNEYGLTDPNPKIQALIYGDPCGDPGFPDWIEEALKKEVGLLPLGLRIGPLFKNDRNPMIKNQMFGNPYGAWIGFWVRIMDSQSILVWLYAIVHPLCADHVVGIARCKEKSTKAHGLAFRVPQAPAHAPLLSPTPLSHFLQTHHTTDDIGTASSETNGTTRREVSRREPIRLTLNPPKSIMTRT